MPRCGHETATEREHSRHDLLREVTRLRRELAEARRRPVAWVWRQWTGRRP